MNDQLNSGKGFLKDKLGGYRVDPPEKVWDSISTRLGGRSRKRTIIIVLSVAATIALAVTLGISYFGPDVPGEAGIAETGIDEAGRETLEEKVARTMEKLTTDEITREESVTEESVTEELAVNVDMEEAAGEFYSREAAAIGNPPQEQTEQLDYIEQPEQMGTTGQPEQMGNTLQSDEMTDMDNTGTEDSPVLDTGDELPTDPIPDLDMDRKKDPRWIIGAALSPLYSFRDAEGGGTTGTSDHESGMISYAAGIHVGYRTTSRLVIESGIFFNKMGISIGAPDILLSNNSFDFAPLGGEVSRSNVMAISNSVGNIVTKSGDIYVNNYKLNESNEVNTFFSSEEYADQGIKQHLDYLELPFNLRYTVVDRDIELQLVGGVSTNLLVNNYVTMETADGPTEIGYLTNIKSVNYSGNAGLGLIYHIHEQFSLRLEPRFRYFLNSVNDKTLPSTRPYTFGLYTGLSYTF
ncbi:MAG: hypothetical protein KAR19_00870 [Bacteroidales bacterium]|nr:hypothetical protein [Bacteroidales bacterium]